VLIGRRLEHILEPRRVVSQAFAGGRAEAIELEINSDSPARGKKLKDIGSDFFIVGALLRKGNVVIPHGDTELESGDLVTIVLQSGAFSHVVNLFSGSESRFPLEFGKNVAVFLKNEDELKNLSEAEYFIRNTKADKLEILTSGDIFPDQKEDQTDTYKAIMKDQDFELYNVQKSLLKEIESNKDSFSIGTILIPFDEKEITKSNKNIFFKRILPLLLLVSFIFNPLKVFAEVAETEINGELINASSEFLRDLDFETWQLVAYKSPLFENKLILRVIGYPGNLRIDHPTDLRVESGRKKWLLDDKTLLNVELANDGRQAAAEFDLDELIKNLDKNRPLRLTLSGVFSELPVPPFVVKEWRSIN